MKDVHGLEGSLIYDATTLEECQAACIVDRTCVAIDWEKRSGQRSCWILASTYVVATSETGVISHFELRRYCPI